MAKVFLPDVIFEVDRNNQTEAENAQAITNITNIFENRLTHFAFQLGVVKVLYVFNRLYLKVF